MPPEEDESSVLAKTREELYSPEAPEERPRVRLSRATRFLPHAWRGGEPIAPPPVKPHHIKLASYFFVGAVAFFGVALLVAGYLLYIGGESVSVNNITLAVQGPATIAGGDTVPLTIAITNRNPVEISDATLEADFPPGTRSATDVLAPMLTYHENLGTLASGETVTRSVKAVVFGSSNSTVSIPISLSYGTKTSRSTFVKKYEYPLAISSTPLSISAETVAETVAGKVFTITLQVRSNATVPIERVSVLGSFPFGFSLVSSSVSASGDHFSIGTLEPGKSKTITLTGTLDGQNGEQRVFHFSVGTQKGSTGALDVTYMTQDAKVTISTPFLETALTLNGASLSNATLSPGAEQDMTVSYTNTLSSNVTDATISVTLSGGAVDYGSVRASNGFYNSSTHTIIFSKDDDPALASLAPGATGLGAFSFRTVPASSFGQAPSVTFSISVSGTRMGESRVPEQISASRVETLKAATAVELSAASLHASGPFANTGPIPPSVDKATTYAVEWKVANAGSTVAGGVVTTTLPSYVEYTGITSGQGSLSYDSKSRKVTWTVGDLTTGAAANASFQVSLTPATSQRSTEPALTSTASFSGYDRFAGVTISASADPVTTETFGDPGYKPENAQVQ
jgi:hypothetical protein